jgi:glycosyltransferase involved in cell wall biosynthesis
VLEHVEFYAQDIRILQELGFDIQITTRINELRSADLYFVWWWTWAFAPLTLAKLLRRPILITGVFDHQLPDGTWELSGRPYWQQWLLRSALEHASANVFISQLEYQQIPRRFIVQQPKYVPCGVATDLYAPNGASKTNSLLTIVWMNPPNAQRKCIPELIQAAAIVHRHYPTIRFIIAGDPTAYRPELEQLVQAVNGQAYIEFPGVISPQQKIEALQQCQIYLQPTRTEGFGLAILEAMSCGAAIITSPVGTVPEVTGDTVVFVDGTKPQQIAQAIMRLLEDETLRTHLGQRARIRAETLFSYEQRKQGLAHILDELLFSTARV